mmetsp:Transcript_47929/g.115131  ORF Transcript_47929/g.115131 Transcript_47929/m.115131 type:complete len:490 (+) Transcript_47929:387-1856(+)
MLLLRGERGDDRAERRERLVDGLRLLEGLAGGLRLGEPLGAGEVDEAQLAHVMVARVQVGGAHRQRDEHVRAGGLVIEPSGGGGARGVALLDERAAVARRVHGLRGAVLDIHAHQGVAHDLELLAGGRLLGVGEQVADVLVVDLDHREEALVCEVRLPLADDAEDAPHRPRHEARLLVCAVHREGLARAALAVGEDAHVEAVEDRCHERLRVGEDFLLQRGRPVDLRELEALLVAPLGCKVAQHHGVGALHADADVALVHLARQRGAHAAVDAQVAHELLQLVVQVFAQLGLGHPLLLKLTRALSGLLLLPRTLGQVRLHPLESLADARLLYRGLALDALPLRLYVPQLLRQPALALLDVGRLGLGVLAQLLHQLLCRLPLLLLHRQLRAHLGQLRPCLLVLAPDGADLLLELRELAAELAAPARHARLELRLLLGHRHVEAVVRALELRETLLQPLDLARVCIGEVARLALQGAHLVEQVGLAALLLA